MRFTCCDWGVSDEEKKRDAMRHDGMRSGIDHEDFGLSIQMVMRNGHADR